MTVLGIDTSGILGGVALVRAGRLMGEVRCDARAAASERILPQIEQLLADLGAGVASVERIGVAIGPGSFTGLRVGLATAKGLALGLGAPVAPVSSLRARMRALDLRDRAILAVTAHRRGAVFSGAGWWSQDGYHELLAEEAREVADAHRWVAEASLAAEGSAGGSLIGTGDAVAVVRAALAGAPADAAAPGAVVWVPGPPGAQPGAAALLAHECAPEELVSGDALDALIPRYLRGSDARRPGGGPQSDRRGGGALGA